MNTHSNTLSLPTHAFRTFRIHRAEHVQGAIETMTLDDLSPGEVVIRTSYAGLNYKDALATTDHGGVVRSFPRVCGSDVSGIVVRSEDPRFRAGDRVLGCAQGLGVDHDGGFSEWVRLRSHQAVPVPDGLSLLDAAALGVAGVTAALTVHLLQQYGVEPAQGEVLVNAATGGVSSMVIELLAARAYSVVACSNKRERHDWLLNLGATQVYTPQELAIGTGLLAKGRWSAAVDCVGGTALDALLRSTRDRGVIACIGNVGGNVFQSNVLPLILRGVRLIGVNLAVYHDLEPMLWQRLASDLKPQHLSANTQVITLDELPQAIENMLQGRTVGRTVVGFGTSEEPRKHL